MWLDVVITKISSVSETKRLTSCWRKCPASRCEWLVSRSDRVLRIDRDPTWDSHPPTSTTQSHTKSMRPRHKRTHSQISINLTTMSWSASSCRSAWSRICLHAFACTCLFVSIYQPVSLPMSVYVSTYICLSVCLSVCVYLSVYLFSFWMTAFSLCTFVLMLILRMSRWLSSH